MVKLKELINKNRHFRDDIKIKMLEESIDSNLVESNLIYEDRIEILVQGKYSEPVLKAIISKYKTHGGYLNVVSDDSTKDWTGFSFYY